MPADVTLLEQKFKAGNPFSLLTMAGNADLMMFHCVTFLRECVYYVDKYDAVVIADVEDDEIFCYDIYANAEPSCSMAELLGIIASEGTKTVTLGSTPLDTANYTVEKANEDNTTLFVLGGKENILHNNAVTLPFLSRA